MTESQKRLKRSKIVEMDIVRALAIIAVVVIHGTSPAAVEWTQEGLSHKLFFIVNKLCLFAVPLFILVSGFVLFYRYRNDWGWDRAVTFYKKRLKSVFVPYLFWSLIYYILHQWLYEDRTGFKLWEFIQLLQWGEASYHLYFMIIIMQFYFIFPMLMTIGKRWKWFFKYMMVTGVLVQLAFYVYRHGFVTLQHAPSMAFSYFAYFMIGGYMGMHYERLVNWITKYRVGLFFVAMFSGMFYVGMYFVNAYSNFFFQNIFFEIVMLVYVVVLSMVFLWIGRLLVKRTKSLVTQSLLSMGNFSFSIYLIHPILLGMFKVSIKAPGDIWLYNVYICSSVVIALLGSWLLTRLYNKGIQIFLLRTTRVK